MFIQNCWYVAAWSKDILQDQLFAISLIGKPVVIYRSVEGELIALEDRCCHRAAPLSLGRIEGSDLRCMYHGMKYDRQGTCIEIPGQNMIPPKARVRAYRVTERHGWVWVWMGDANKADPDLIPAAVGPEDPNYTLRMGFMDYAANYQLINDNLTDFTHLSYVHSKSFGTSEEFARTRPEVTVIPRGIRVQRWVFNAMIDQNDKRPERGAVAGNELWQTYDFLAPGILLMYNAPYPPGTADRAGREAPTSAAGEPLSWSFTSQAVTPMTERTSRYFYSWGPNKTPASETIADAMMGVAQLAFGEDKAMIEAQQKSIDVDPDRPEVLTSADAGPMRMRRIIEDLCNAERPLSGISQTA
jgi:phenylpropionate dioxygenase-like ring-hydroxylating dioxygenase large terminal subunit